MTMCLLCLALFKLICTVSMFTSAKPKYILLLNFASFLYPVTALRTLFVCLLFVIYGECRDSIRIHT